MLCLLSEHADVRRAQRLFIPYAKFAAYYYILFLFQIYNSPVMALMNQQPIPVQT